MVFLINHFDLFGLRQVYLYFRGHKYTYLKFRTPFFYRYVRHPLYVGWLLTFWSAPVMTIAHFFFAAMTTAYILVAIRFEETDPSVAYSGNWTHGNLNRAWSMGTVATSSVDRMPTG